MFQPCRNDIHAWGPYSDPAYDEAVDTWWIERRCDDCLIVDRLPVDGTMLLASYQLRMALLDVWITAGGERLVAWLTRQLDRLPRRRP